MIRIFRDKRVRREAASEYWLAGQFSRKPHPFADRAMAAWSEILGRDGAALWLKAKARDGRGR